jgi:hypothetical protein
LVESRGVRGSSLRVGVHRQDGRLFAHAWVEYQGVVLADEEWRVRQFDELAQLELGRAS